MIDTNSLTFNDLDREVATPAGYGRLVGYGRTHVFILERSSLGDRGREPLATQVKVQDATFLFEKAESDV